MRSFFKTFFASFLALIIFAIVGFFVLVFIISSAATPEKAKIGSNAVLVLDLTKEYKERKDENLVGTFTNNSDMDIPGLYDVIRMIAYSIQEYGQASGLCNLVW